MSAARPLKGIGIVLTRPRAQSDAAARELEREGARVIVFPALEIEPNLDTPALREALGGLPSASFAIFVSLNAVEHGVAAALRHGPWPATVAVAGMGDATAAALRNSGFERVISPTVRFDSEGLLMRPELQAVRGQHIVIFRGAGGREKLRETLQARGARVTYAEVYRRVRPASDPVPLLLAWTRGAVHAIQVMSVETLANFVALVGAPGESLFATTTLVVPHETIARHEHARRFGKVLVAASGEAGLKDALLQLRATT
jgi:uroporphyrinogen-III synthase